MNSRIAILVKQAGLSINDVNVDTFSKLLIEECAVAAERMARSFSDEGGAPGCSAAAAAVRNVGRADTTSIKDYTNE